MKIFNKENCCLCLSLRTGTLIIGWFQVIICVFIIFKTLGDWPKANKNESEKWVHYGDEWKEKIANIENITRSYSFLIYSSAGFSSAVFLLIGVYGKCFFLIVQWVVVFSAGMVVNLYMFINFLQRSFKVDIQTFWTVFLAIFVFGFFGICISNVVTYGKSLKASNVRKAQSAESCEGNLIHK